MDNLTLRQYYAANAPKDIPDWFVHSRAKPVVIPDYRDLDPRIQREALSWLQGRRRAFDDGDHPDLVQFQTDYLSAKNSARDGTKVTEEANYFAWRWYYADQMIKSERSA